MEYLKGDYLTCDFDENTLTIEIEEDFRVYNTKCIVIPTRDLTMQQQTDLIDFLENLK